MFELVYYFFFMVNFVQYQKGSSYVMESATLNESFSKFSNFTKQIIKNINILHECKDSRDANKLLGISINKNFMIMKMMISNKSFFLNKLKT